MAGEFFHAFQCPATGVDFLRFVAVFYFVEIDPVWDTAGLDFVAVLCLGVSLAVGVFKFGVGFEFVVDFLSVLGDFVSDSDGSDFDGVFGLGVLECFFKYVGQLVECWMVVLGPVADVALVAGEFDNPFEDFVLFVDDFSSVFTFEFVLAAGLCEILECGLDFTEFSAGEIVGEFVGV